METLPLPLFLDLRRRAALVVGAGAVARAKAAALARAGARVVLVAPELASEAAPPGVEARARRFEDSDLDGVALVIAATDDRQLNRRIAEACLAGGPLCNAVDDPEVCDILFGATARSGVVQAAVSTNGASPSLAMELRDRIAASVLRPEAGLLAGFLEERRPRTRVRSESYGLKKVFWRAVLGSSIPDDLAAGRSGDAAARFEELFAAFFPEEAS